MAAKEVTLGQVHFLDAPFGGFTYRLPGEAAEFAPGLRVRVPFGHRQRVGVLTELSQGSDDERYRDVSAPVDAVPVVGSELLNLTRWVASYYLCEWGEALAAALPKGLKPRSRVRYQLSGAGREVPWMNREAGVAGQLWRALSERALTAREVARRFPNGKIWLERFRRRGWVEAVEVGATVPKARWAKRWKWTGVVDFGSAQTLVSPKHHRLRETLTLLQNSGGELQQVRDGRVMAGLASQLRALEKRGWVKMERTPWDHRSAVQAGIPDGLEDFELSETQRAAVNRIGEAIRAGGYRAFLLYGVTGSGKTLIYLEVIQVALEAGCGVVMLVPEISLTPQVVGRIKRRFGGLAAVTHSAMSPAERRQVWESARSGAVRVVVGPRSAVFAPVNRLGLVIVDEEHDDNYKQSEPAPRYHARDVAVYRARLAGATVLLGSATPDVVTFHSAKSGKYELLELPERHRSVPMPMVWVVKHGVGGERSVFSRKLLAAIAERLSAHEQTILVVNRRGFSTCVWCPDCGEVSRCPNCSITLRYHRVGEEMRCHYCNYTAPVVDVCPKCRGRRLRFSGIATQRVERELQILFPQARIARMDWDTTRSPGAHQELLSRFAAGAFDILLGTQMVAKGHDYPKVTLVGVIAADFEWLQPDFRSAERAFRLLEQASGRSGRVGRGEVIIQALQADHLLLRWVQAHDYLSLYAAEMVGRRELGYPPFGRLVSVTIAGADKNQVRIAAEWMRDAVAPGLETGKVLGPTAPAPEKVSGVSRQRLLVKFPPRVDSKVVSDKRRLVDFATLARKNFRRAGLNVALDVDPVEV